MGLSVQFQWVSLGRPLRTFRKDFRGGIVNFGIKTLDLLILSPFTYTCNLCFIFLDVVPVF